MDLGLKGLDPHIDSLYIRSDMCSRAASFMFICLNCFNLSLYPRFIHFKILFMCSPRRLHIHPLCSRHPLVYISNVYQSPTVLKSRLKNSPLSRLVQLRKDLEDKAREVENQKRLTDDTEKKLHSAKNSLEDAQTQKQTLTTNISKLSQEKEQVEVQVLDLKEKLGERRDELERLVVNRKLIEEGLMDKEREMKKVGGELLIHCITRC